MKFLNALALVIFVTAQSVPAQEPAAPQLPEGFPRLNFSVNPVYYSIGIKLGHVLSVRRERPLLSTFEGEMMLGFGSSPEQVSDRLCAQSIIQPQSGRGNTVRRDDLAERAAKECFLFDNPWRFSFLTQSLFDSLTQIKDQPVLIYYINYYFAPSHILMRTRNQVLGVFPIEKNLAIDRRIEVRSWARALPLSGFISGRIVQASLEFPFRKTYEIIIQESQNANNFIAMSVSNRRVFDYIMQAMLTGKLLRVGYVRLYHPHAAIVSTLFNYITSYRIVSVELAE